jgi:hypothetical protein
MTETKFVVAPAFRHLNPDIDLSGNLRTGFNQIRYRNKVWGVSYQGTNYRFVRPDDGNPAPYLDVVFLRANPDTSRMYYEDDYNEGDANAPVCASVNGVVPDPGVPKPQSKTCGGCKHSRWIDGSKPACQSHKRTAVLLLPTMKTSPPLPDKIVEPIFLKIPPGSFTPFAAHSANLRRKGIPPPSCVTRIGFAPDKLFQFTFGIAQMLTDAEAKRVLELVDDPKTIDYIGAMPEIREVDEDDVLAPAQTLDTGLLAAFGDTPPEPQNLKTVGVPIKRSPGRPRKPAESAPAPVITPMTSSPKPEPGEPIAETPWEESDDVVEAELHALMERSAKMLPPS